MPQISARSEKGIVAGKGGRTAAVGWVVAAVCFSYLFALRSAPSVVLAQLSETFGISTLGVASIVGLFYDGYSSFSLVAGAAM